ncbi:phosphopantetheine-binding protein [Saccharopolyspora sp. 5N708]|uniref:phosphopantetheine-binding protein n=1 Tax=Saccharopolyspora sp. 5N708 TaxID=3457424 RepID=UPI003FD2C4F3
MTKDLRELVGGVWKDVLDLDVVNDDDDFFELGGDSMQAVDVVYRLRDAGVDLKVGDFFAHPTLHELSTAISVAASAA